ncbi:MAG: LIC_12708 family protein [Spirochaetota bacterium]
MSLRSRVRMLLALSALAVLLPSACSRSHVPVLERQDLFSLEYGKMEDQIELYLDGSALTRKTRMAMRGGLFYVASGYGNRIMEFTSYGDLLTLYYNPSQNPRPVMLQSSSDEERVTNRRAYEYPFNTVGEVAVTSDKTLLVEDQVPDRVAVFDEELGVRLNRVVVRLDQRGNQIDYLGQEGIGGSFFPHIQEIEVTASDEIVVVTSAPPRSIVYWFASDGTLLRRVEITPDTLPVPSDVAAAPILESIRPDQELRRLYAKINYYAHDEGDAGGGGSINRLMSRVYWLNIDDGAYEGFVDVPRNVRRDGVLGALGEDEEFYYELLGAASNEHLFLLSRESEQESQLLILHTSGKVVRRRTLGIDYEDVVIRDLHVSHDGILSGMLATRDDVALVWWRTDRLFEAGVAR